MTERRTGIFATALVVAFCGGCAGTQGGVRTNAYEGVYNDLSSLTTTVYGSEMRVQTMRSNFCVRRAEYNRRKAGENSFWDTFLLVAAGVATGGGATLGATTAVMDDSGTKKDLQIDGAGTLAAGGAILALRTALSLNDLARTQRIAAANDIDTAIDILEKYVLSDDPKEVGPDGFHGCRDEEINVAHAFPDARVSGSVEKQTEEAKELKKVADAKLAEARSGETEAQRVLAVRTEAHERAQENLKHVDKDGRTATEAASTRSGELKVDAEIQVRKAAETRHDAEIEAAKADIAARKAEYLKLTYLLRRFVFYGTKGDVTHTGTLLDHASKDLDKAKEEYARLLEERNAPPSAPAKTK